MTAYPMFVEPLDDNEGGGFMAFFPDLPGCMSDGETEVEAVTNALDAFRAWMEVQTERGAQIPQPFESHKEFAAAGEAMETELEKLRQELSAAKAKIRRLESGQSRWQPRAKFTKANLRLSATA